MQHRFAEKDYAMLVNENDVFRSLELFHSRCNFEYNC
jgi:hypothetical protein